ncbi:MAG: hypothetical protein VB144_03095 [Clostridia bacterium]|nr:hypothetical protein [Clostridia bacterium]
MVDLAILWVEMKRGFTRKLRSPVEQIAEVFAVYVFMAGAVLGVTAGRAATAERGGAAVSAACIRLGAHGSPGQEMLFGFCAVFLCLSALQSAARLSTEEPGSGILEQLCVSSAPLWRIVILRDIASMISILPDIAVIVAAVSVTTGVRFASPPPGACLPMGIMRMGVLGMGFALGGVALMSKRVGALVNLVSMGLFAMVFAGDPASSGWRRTLEMVVPFGPCYRMARDIAFRGMSLQHFASTGILWTSMAACASHLVIGIVLFNLAFRWAAQRGLLTKA